MLGKPVPLHGRDRAIVPNGIEGYVATSAGRPGCVGVLIVLDGEGDCVAQLGPALSDRARKITGKPVFVALADHDYEDWIYASVETLQLGDIAYDPSKRGVTTLQKVLRPTKYVKPVWQPRLTSRIDINMAASRSPSLKRMLARFDQLTKHLP